MVMRLFGSIYIRNKPVATGQRARRYALYKNNPSLCIGDTKAGCQIAWAEVNGLLVATRNVVRGVSWVDLERNGLISGKRITIDGDRYNLRLLGKTAGGDSEWDMIKEAAIKEGIPASEFWHSSEVLSWCQDGPSGVPNCGIVRGGPHWSDRTNYPLQERDELVGWRPALEPVVLQLSELLKKRVKVTGKFGTVQGILVGYTDYDILLEIPGVMPEQAYYGRFCARVQPGIYALDRGQVKEITLEVAT